MKNPKVTPLQVFNSLDPNGKFQKTCKVEIDYYDKKEYKLVQFSDLGMVKYGLRSESKQEKIIPELTKAHISNLINKNKLPKDTKIEIPDLVIRDLLNNMKKQ